MGGINSSVKREHENPLLKEIYKLINFASDPRDLLQRKIFLDKAELIFYNNISNFTPKDVRAVYTDLTICRNQIGEKYNNR